MDASRRKTPRYPPCKDVVRLRKGGWTYEAIARELKASTREVYRWQAGDSRPLGVYADMLAALPTQPPRVSRHYKFRPEEPEGSKPEEPEGSKPEEPEGSKPEEPEGSKPEEPEGSKPEEPESEAPEEPESEAPDGGSDPEAEG